MPSITAEQFDLITDDPRVEAVSGMAELRRYLQAGKEHHGLLTQSQAARILGVSPGHIATWIQRGRLWSDKFVGVPMVSGGEVIALAKERAEQGVKTYGRGHKATTLCTLVTDAMKDFEENQ